MYKIITAEPQANRFHEDGSQCVFLSARSLARSLPFCLCSLRRSGFRLFSSLTFARFSLFASPFPPSSIPTLTFVCAVSLLSLSPHVVSTLCIPFTLIACTHNTRRSLSSLSSHTSPTSISTPLSLFTHIMSLFSLSSHSSPTSHTPLSLSLSLHSHLVTHQSQVHGPLQPLSHQRHVDHHCVC